MENTENKPTDIDFAFIRDMVIDYLAEAGPLPLESSSAICVRDGQAFELKFSTPLLLRKTKPDHKYDLLTRQD